MRPIFVLLVVFVLSLAMPAKAYGPKGHLVTANETLDDLGRQPGGGTLLVFQNGTGSPISLPVSSAVAIQAILAHPDFYRAGSLGPDAFPDIVTGQLFAHGNSVPLMMGRMRSVAQRAGIVLDMDPTIIASFAGLDYDAPFEHRHGISEYRAIDFAMAMLRHWATTLNNGSVESQQALAFIVGYLGHGVGDGFLHTWLNEHAEGAWSYEHGRGAFGKFTEEIRHLAIENALDLRIPNGPLSSDGSGANLARMGLRLPLNFLDGFYSAQTANAFDVGDIASTSPVDFVDHFRLLDRYHGGPTYAYFNAQVSLVDALGRWSRLKPFFDLRVNQGLLATVEGYASLIEFSEKLNNQISTLADPLSVLVSRGFNRCGIHPWLSTNVDLPNTLRDISLILGFPDRLQRQTIRAESARKNWLILNSCTAANIARIKMGPAALPATDACADVVRADWGPGGLQDGGLLSGSGVREADREFQRKTEKAFLGGGPGTTLEQTGEFRRVGPNIERIYSYLLTAGFTAGSIMDAIFPEELSRDWRNELDSFCGAIMGTDENDLGCLVSEIADKIATGIGAVECERDHGQCVISSQEECLRHNCNELCPSLLNCSSFCGEPSRCVSTCNSRFRWCPRLFRGKVCVPLGPAGPGDPSLLLTCRAGCSAFVGGARKCAEASFDTVQCGIESVICHGDNIKRDITGQAGDEILKPLKNVCRGITEFFDAVQCLEEGDPNAAQDAVWSGRLDCAMSLCTATLANPVTGPALAFTDAEAKCREEVTGIKTVLENARGSAEAVSHLHDVLSANPVQFLNLAYLDEDIVADPVFALNVGINLAIALFGGPFDALPLADRCSVLRQVQPICTPLGLCPALPAGCPVPTPGESRLFGKLAEDVPAQLAEIRQATQDARVAIDFLLNNGIIPNFPGPRATVIFAETGAAPSAATFDPIFNSVQGMKLATLVDRSSTDALFTRAGIQQNGAYSQICRETGFASPYCDVMMSFDDPNCIGMNASTEQCPAGLTDDLGNGLQWSVGRGLFAFNQPGQPNELTRFAPAGTHTANTALYDRIFRGPHAAVAASMLRGGPSRAGFFPVRGPTSAARTLSFSPLAFGWSAPVAGFNDDIFFGTRLGNLHSVRINSARTAFVANWNRDINTAEQPSAGQVTREHVGGGFVDYIYVGGETIPLVSNALLKLRADTGALVWAHSPFLLDEIVGSPLVDLAAGQVYFTSRSNTLHAVRTSDGTALWTVDLTGGRGSIFTATEGSLSQGPDKILYAAMTDGRLVAVDPAPGLATSARRRWERSLGGATISTPVVGSGSPYLIYTGTRENELLAVRSDGTIAWRLSTGPWWTTADIDAPAAVSPDGVVYFGGEDQVLHAVSAASGAELWRFPVNGAIRGGPIVDRAGTIYVATRSGRLYALRPGAGLSNAARPYFTTNLDRDVIDSLSLTQNGTLLVTARGIPSLFAVLP